MDFYPIDHYALLLLRSVVFAKKQSSTDMTDQLWMESLLINLELGRLPRPASKVRWNAGLAMTESLFHPKRTTQGGE